MSEPPSDVRVACAIERPAYLRHCAAMLHSLLIAHPDDRVHVELLHGPDSPARGRRRLEAMVGALGGTIDAHPVPRRWLDNVPVRGFTGRASWYRILLADLLPSTDRVLYLDADLIVLESVAPLFTLDLEGAVLGAVTNLFTVAAAGHAERIGLAGDSDYFNAGVLLLDLALMREENVRARVLEWARAHGDRHGLRDQDALNAVLAGRRLPLHPRWNCMNTIVHSPRAVDVFGADEVAEARARPAIRHFEGPAFAKPWHLLSPPEARRLYAEHRRGTPWPRITPSGMTPGNLVRRARRRGDGG